MLRMLSWRGFVKGSISVSDGVFCHGLDQLHLAVAGGDLGAIDRALGITSATDDDRAIEMAKARLDVARRCGKLPVCRQPGVVVITRHKPTSLEKYRCCCGSS